jgi:GxxExxY protein
MTPISTEKENEDPRTHSIIGAAMETHRQLGHGFLEGVYQEALSLEFVAREIPFRREALISIRYKEQLLSCTYRADFVCFGDILVELKALAAIGGNDQAQIVNYLKASGLRLGLLLNFGASRLQIKRLVFDRKPTSTLNQPFIAV